MSWSDAGVCVGGGDKIFVENVPLIAEEFIICYQNCYPDDILCVYVTIQIDNFQFEFIIYAQTKIK